MTRTPDALNPRHSEAFEELAAGAALGALSESDRALFETHLATCRHCQELLARYGSVAADLPEALPQIDASPQLRRRVIEAARTDLTSETTTSSSLTSSERPMETRRVASRRSTALWMLPAAALMLVTLGLGYWNYRLQQQLAEQTASAQAREQALVAAAQVRDETLAALAGPGREWSLAGTNAAPNAGGLLVEDPDDPRPFLVVYGLPEAQPQRAYQAWVITEGGPVGAGILEPGKSGVQLSRLEQPLANARAVAVTMEPIGGSAAPTGPILVAVEL